MFLYFFRSTALTNYIRLLEVEFYVSILLLIENNTKFRWYAQQKHIKPNGAYLEMASNICEGFFISSKFNKGAA